MKRNATNICDGLTFLQGLKDEEASCCFFDPQYKKLLNKMNYGEQHKNKRQQRRHALPGLEDTDILEYTKEITRVLKPSGHLFLWLDKFYMTDGFRHLVEDMPVVDMLVWDKMRMGMGYRSRNCCEFVIAYQKAPKRAKDVWTDNGMRDVFSEKASNKSHPHAKPVGMQQRMIKAVTKKGDLVIDPSAGSYSVLKCCLNTGRDFLGCDLNECDFDERLL